jgi:hypothetical protein
MSWTPHPHDAGWLAFFAGLWTMLVWTESLR